MISTMAQITAAIDERLGCCWRKKFLDEGAPPLVAIGLKQLRGPSYAQPVVCTVEDMTRPDLASFLRAVALSLEKLDEWDAADAEWGAIGLCEEAAVPACDRGGPFG